MSGSEGGSQPGSRGSSSAGYPASSLRPQTASVLAALASRGVDLPGVSRKAGDAEGAPGTSEPGDSPRYTVLDQVARGGMGVVLRVRDEDLRRELAMKVLDRADRQADAAASDPRDLGRFLEEAQVTGQLDHPGVPPIHELGLDQEGRLFFTMKLVRGGTFADVIAAVREGKDGWTTTRALGVVLKVCEAMAYAHHKGVIHRDIKPANIMVGRFGETYVMDWGLAKVLEDGREAGGRSGYDSLVSRSIVHTDRREAVGDAGSSHATLHGDVVGTPAYMAPEQAGGEIDAMGPHSDIYAVGALLYHLLCGQAPYIKPGLRVSPHSVLRWVIDGPPKPLSELAPDAPPELVAVIDKAMAREPSLRYTSMLDLAADLQAFIEDRVVRAYQSGAWAEARKWMVRNKPLAVAAGLLLLVTLGSLGAISWVQSRGRQDVEERNLLLSQSYAALERANTQLAETNAAVESSNAQLGQANTALADKNTELAETNAALDEERAAAELARAAAERAREEALENAELARANAERAEANARVAAESERRARVESYAANMTAAAAALESGAGSAARRHLAACPEDLRGWDWRHLSLRADASLAVWTGADSLVVDIEHSPDGRLLALGCGPFNDFGAPVRELRILDAATGELLMVLPSESAVRQVAFSPDGRLLAFGTEEDVRVWDLERERLLTARQWLGHSAFQMQFLDDERLLVLSVDKDKDTSRLDIWNTTRLDVDFSRDSNPAMTRFALSSDRTHLAIGLSDSSVELWPLPDGTPAWRRAGRDASDDEAVQDNDLPGVTGMAFDARGERLVVTDRDHTVRLFDARDGQQLVVHELDDRTAFAPHFHPDGPWIVLGDTSGSVRFLDADTLAEIERLAGHDSNVLSLSISADGDQIVSAGMLGDLRVWDGRPGAASLVLANPATTDDVGVTPWARAIAFSPDGRLVAWTASPKAALMTDAYTGEVLYRLHEAQSSVAAMAFSADGQRLMVKTEIALLTFEVSSGRMISSVNAGGYAIWAAFDLSGSLIAVPTRGDRVEVRLTDSGALALTLRGHTDSVWAGQFSADSQRLVTCSQDRTIRTWDLRTGQAVQVIEANDNVYRLELFDDDRRAVTTSLDPARSGLSVWDLERGERIVTHPARTLTLRGSLHPDQALFAGGSGKAVSLWSLERGEMFSIPAGDWPVIRTRFDPTGQRLAALDRGGHLLLWDTMHPRDRRDDRRGAARMSRRVGEARTLVTELFEEHLLMRRVIAALQADPTLGDSLREAAVREARVRGDLGSTVVARLWERLLPDGVADDELTTAPEVVTAAGELLPLVRDVRDQWSAYEEAWEPLGWVLLVLGRAEEAAPLVQQGIDAGYSFDPSGPRACFAIQALISAELGDEEPARTQLANAREEFEDGQRDSPDDVSDLKVNARLIALAEARLGDG